MSLGSLAGCSSEPPSRRWRSGLAAYAAFGWHWLHGIELAGNHQHKTSHLSIPTTFARLTGLDPTAVRATALVLYAALFIYLLDLDLARRPTGSAPQPGPASPSCWPPPGSYPGT